MQICTNKQIKLCSVKGHNAFNTIYQRSRKFRSGNTSAAVVYRARNTVTEDKHTIYFGVTIGKRCAKYAVIRNRVKRLLREALRIVINDLSIDNCLRIDKVILSYYFAPQHPNQLHLSDVLTDVRIIFMQICK